jgi:hypothetical protein
MTKRPKPPAIKDIVGRKPTGRSRLSPEEKALVIATIQSWLSAFRIQCESAEYEKYSSPLDFSCSHCLHRWTSNWHYVRAHPRCMFCNSSSKPRRNPIFAPTQKELLGYQVSGRKMTNQESSLYLSKMAEWCLDRGIKLRERTYRGNTYGVRLQCMTCGHKWKARLGNIRTGRGCPKCSSESTGEAVCRAVFEYLFDAPFPSVWVPWLRGKKNSRLQLDGFNSELKIAFEHQGAHHTGPIYGRSPTSKARYRRTLRTDNLKRKACAKKGVTLFDISEIGGRISIQDAQAHIITLVEKSGITVAAEKKAKKLDLATILKSRESKGWSKLKEVVTSRSGRLLSAYYMGWKAQHRFKCDDPNHPAFSNNPSNVISLKQWCPRCGAGKRNRAKRLAAFARYQQSAGVWRIEILTLADDYHRQSQKLKLRCLDCGTTFLRRAQYLLHVPNYCEKSVCNKQRKSRRRQKVAVNERNGPP